MEHLFGPNLHVEVILVKQRKSLLFFYEWKKKGTRHRELCSSQIFPFGAKRLVNTKFHFSNKNNNFSWYQCLPSHFDI